MLLRVRPCLGRQREDVHVVGARRGVPGRGAAPREHPDPESVRGGAPRGAQDHGRRQRRGGVRRSARIGAAHRGADDLGGAGGDGGRQARRHDVFRGRGREVVAAAAVHRGRPLHRHRGPHRRDVARMVAAAPVGGPCSHREGRRGAAGRHPAQHGARRRPDHRREGRAAGAARRRVQAHHRGAGGPPSVPLGGAIVAGDPGRGVRPRRHAHAAGAGGLQAHARAHRCPRRGGHRPLPPGEACVGPRRARRGHRDRRGGGEVGLQPAAIAARREGLHRRVARAGASRRLSHEELPR
mmetsp:Transcript_66858/g.186853  ORF Transcript_66858/g.186853 Transcript_66858/m.186853 type:complete len:296 (+) Transcript_66858:301-1188(+)